MLNIQASVGQPGEEESRGRELGEGGKRKRPQSGRGDLLIFSLQYFSSSERERPQSGGGDILPISPCGPTVKLECSLRLRSGGSGGTVEEVVGVEARISLSRSTK